MSVLWTRRFYTPMKKARFQGLIRLDVFSGLSAAFYKRLSSSEFEDKQELF